MDTTDSSLEMKEKQMNRREFKRCRTKADVLADSRVAGYEHGCNPPEEWGKDIWVELKTGWHWEGCGHIHEDCWKDVCLCMEEVERQTEEEIGSNIGAEVSGREAMVARILAQGTRQAQERS